MSNTIKVRLRAAAMSNVSYNRSEVLDTEIEVETWEAMTQDDRDREMDDMAREWLFEDIDLSAEVTEP